jgi:membrane associated rhomboid family serine protease
MANWIFKNSNDQTSGWKAALSFPGNMFILDPLIFIGLILYDYWSSKYDAQPFHPLWFRATWCAIVFGCFVGWIVGVIFSERKRGLKRGDKTPFTD